MRDLCDALRAKEWSRVNDYAAQFIAIGKPHAWVGFLLLILLQNAGFLTLAYGLGIATRWVWGPIG